MKYCRSRWRMWLEWKKLTKKKKKKKDCWCQNKHPQDTAIQTHAHANMSACRRQRTSVHTHRHTELRQLTASAPRPQVQWWPLLQPHLPLSCLILLVGSIIWLAVWVPVSCFPGDSQATGAGRHWAEASPASAAAVWETERGAAQMWESGANRRYGMISASAMFVIPPFPGRKKPGPWSGSQQNT